MGLVTTRPVIGIISVDNYDDLEDVISDSDISNINSFIANFVEEFTAHYHMFYRRVGMDRFYLFTDYTVLEQIDGIKIFSYRSNSVKKLKSVSYLLP